MSMSKFFVYIIIFCSILLKTFSCIFTKYKGDTGIYESVEKYSDPEYILQNRFIEICENSFSEIKKVEIDFAKRFFVRTAIQEIFSKMGIEDQTRFILRKMEDCLGIIASHKVKK